MTIREASRWATGILGELDSPRTDAELLLCSLMNWQRHELFLHTADSFHGNLLEEYRQMVMLRRNRTPLQHITGSVEFMGRSFLSGPEALVPRPETESLVEAVLENLTSEPGSILDVGTGSGVIAVTLALEFPSTLVIGTDISLEALNLARRNGTMHRVENLDLVAMDLLDAVASAQRFAGFDALVANLPYIPSDDLFSLQPEVRIGDPLSALDGGCDGTTVIQRLLPAAAGALLPDGLLALEIGENQAMAVTDILSKDACNWKSISVKRDLAGVERVICAVKAGEVNS